MSHLRNGMVEAAKRLGVHPDVLVPLGGAASEVFAAGDKVLRIGTPEVIDVELAASAAASKVIPVPSVLAREDAAGEAAVLLERMAGTPAWHPGLSDTTVRRRGRACGNLHALMATIDPPPGVPSIEIGALPAAPARLLHLDLHPLNVLVNDDEEITAVLDWTNAAAGPADCDRARTATILYLDPAVESLRSDPTWHAFVDGWTESGALNSLPSAAVLWACRYALKDLDTRFDSARLSTIRRLSELLDGTNEEVDVPTLVSEKGPL